MRSKFMLCSVSIVAVAMVSYGADAVAVESEAKAATVAVAGEAQPVVEEAVAPVAVLVRPDDAAVKEAVDKGVAWLKRHQLENGSWSNPNYPGLTALGLWALVSNNREDMAAECQKAADFIAGFAQEDGGIYKPATAVRGSGGLSTYNTAICMTALHAYKKQAYTPMILKARTFVAGSQLEGDSGGAGGYGYEGINATSPMARDRADLSNTGWALTAMRLTQDLEDLRPAGEKKADVDWKAALAFVEKLQNRDEEDSANFGGFGYEAGGSRSGASEGSVNPVALRSFGSMTYAGLEAMIYAQVGRDDPRVRSAVAWAARHWSVNENPGMGSKGLFYYYTIMAKSLDLAAGGDTIEREKGEPIAWKTELLVKLLKEQKGDGSWANSDNAFWEADPALVTAYALLTIGYIQGN